MDYILRQERRSQVGGPSLPPLPSSLIADIDLRYGVTLVGSDVDIVADQSGNSMI